MMRLFRRSGLRLAALAGLLALLAATQVAAQQQGSGAPPATVTPQAPVRTVAAVRPVSGGFYAWLMAKQGDFNQRLAQTIRDIRTEPVVATLLLTALSFAYGILHAAGPGHGKAVISSYVLANEETVRRGIALSFLASLFQALSAILLFAILVLVFKATGVTRKASEAWLETISWGLVVLLGAGMLYGQIRRFLAERRGLPVAAHAGHAHHDHTQHLDHSHAPVDHAAHDHAHDEHGECCGHAHMPDPKQLAGPWSWSKALGLAFAVGIRPCTGALFVLGFALSQGLLWAGVFATFAMALGTAITVSTLAALAVGSREFAARFGGPGNSRWAGSVRTVAGIGGSLAVLGFGLMLFVGSLGPQGAF